jgi:HK97 family phage major capsid protein
MIAASPLTGSVDMDAGARLARHHEEMRVERPRAAQRAQFDLSSTDSAGGYTVAPLWANEEFAPLARSGRPVAEAIGIRPLPPNTDSINIPTIATGTATATQSSDNAAIQETDATFSTVAADVKTIAGMQDVSQQLLDRSVPGIDEIIYRDLMADYWTKQDTAVINSSTSNNLGLNQVSSPSASTYTDADPTVGEFYPKLADVLQQIASNVFAPADAIFMHPRRWGWLLAARDTTGRPLFAPSAAQNAPGTFAVPGEGAAGSLMGNSGVPEREYPDHARREHERGSGDRGSPRGSVHLGGPGRAVPRPVPGYRVGHPHGSPARP